VLLAFAVARASLPAHSLSSLGSLRSLANCAQARLRIIAHFSLLLFRIPSLSPSPSLSLSSLLLPHIPSPLSSSSLHLLSSSSPSSPLSLSLSSPSSPSSLLLSSPSPSLLLLLLLLSLLGAFVFYGVAYFRGAGDPPPPFFKIR